MSFSDPAGAASLFWLEKFGDGTRPVPDQIASTSDRPFLLKVNYDSGYFTDEKIVTFNNIASQITFLLRQTGLKVFQPGK
jgi:hypothetical protein